MSKILTIRFRTRPNDGKGRVPYENTWCIFGNRMLVAGGYETKDEALMSALNDYTAHGSWQGAGIEVILNPIS